MIQYRSPHECSRAPGREIPLAPTNDVEQLAVAYLRQAEGNPSLALRMLAAELLAELPGCWLPPSRAAGRVARHASGERA